MLIRVPDYFENFHCLAGACPHSCCIGWEVVVDDSTAARYREVPGPLGDKLRAALRQRLRRFLDLAARAQALLDQDETAGLPALEAGEPEVPAHREAAGLFPDALRLLGTLEILEPDWEEVLRQAEDVPGTAAPETALERIAVYFAFRYLLKTVNDGDLLSRAQLCVFAVLVVQRLSAVCGLPEALRRFSREIEHSEDNVEALLDAFRFTFPQEDFLAELAK